MYTVLMVAALAVGSGDGRGGATDGRTGPDRFDPPLWVGMDIAKAEKAMLSTERFTLLCRTKRFVAFEVIGSSKCGNWQVVTIYYGADGVTKWDVESFPPTRSR